MAVDPKISILTFPQKLVGSTLHLNVLIIPRNIDPFEPWPETGAPAWVSADLKLQAVAIKGLDALPYVEPAVIPPFPIAEAGIPAQAKTIFNILKAKFNIVPAPAGSPRRLQKPVETDFARKYLPPTYRNAFHFNNPRTEDAVTDDSYHCAIKKNNKINPAFVPSGNQVSWGEVFAYCLRQPALAKKVGFIYETSITIDPDLFEEGGWLFTDVVDGGSYSTAADKAFLKRYAARIPALPAGGDRNIFAAIQFPVKLNAADTDPIGFDPLYPEASAYDDGFAKIVHANQPVSADLLQEEADDNPPIHDVGIRLGWDDEQVLIWLNRQLRPDPNDASKQTRLDAPLGVFQYHIDARKKAVGEGPQEDWTSLTLVRNKADIAVDSSDPSTVIDVKDNLKELGVEVYPMKLDGYDSSHYWLPAYFTQWIGKTLVLPDKDAAELFKTTDAGATLADLYHPESETSLKLVYGQDYEFRVRLSDPTGGGPGFLKDPINEPVYESESPVAVCSFRRHVVPQPVLIQNTLPKKDGEYFEDTTLTLQRPRLGYPSVVFTGKYGPSVIDMLKADRDEAMKFEQDPVTKEITTMSREIGLHDPDVEMVEICVEVKSLEMDTLLSKNRTEAYAHLYTTLRKFPPDRDGILDVPVSYVDAPVLKFATSSPILQDLGLSVEAEPVNIHEIAGIVLPTARDMRITLRAVCDNTINYYGDDRFRYGKIASFFARKASENETQLIKNNVDTEEIRAIYLQPDADLLTDPRFFETFFLGESFRSAENEKQPDMIQRLAQELRVESKGFSLLGKAGKRFQFGCSREIRNSISPDGTSITFSTKADLLNHWIVPIKLLLDRDWTWDGLDVVAFEIARKKWFKSKAKPATSEIVGDIEVKKIINPQALKKPDRQQTWFVFLDAVDPKPAPGDHPDLVALEYTIRAKFRTGHAGSQDNDIVFSLELPVTTPPIQVPKIVSAGLALSKYKRDEKTYATTEPRQKYLWLEFDQPLLDPNDAYFVRVQAYAPDPLLSDWRWELFRAPAEPVLAIDPEWIRVITPDQPGDNSGLDAMQEMINIGGDKNCHYIVPLPPGLHADSSELFGFFTYELRVGHRHIWSTAQGRFGKPLRTAGVQHASPTLFQTVDRNEINITVSAPFATAVSNGKNVTSKPPRTQLWALLYAQVPQADGQDFRNILLDDRLLLLQPKNPKLPFSMNDDAPAIGAGGWQNKEVVLLLKQLGLPEDAALSVLCVEMLPVVFSLLQNNPAGPVPGARQNDLADADFKRTMINHLRARFGPEDRSEERIMEQADYNAAVANQIRPLSNQLGNYRILRTSPLVAVPAICCVDC